MEDNPNKDKGERSDSAKVELPISQHGANEPAAKADERRKLITHAEYWAQRRREGLTQSELDAARRSLPPIVPMGSRNEITGIDPDEFEEAEVEPKARVTIRVVTPFPLWFKALVAAIIVVPVLFLAGRSYYDSHENIAVRDWQKFMDQSCNPTVHGRLKTIFYDELDLWVHINISMRSWEQSTRGDSRICEIDYPGPANEIRRSQCLARYEAKADWYARCEPVVLLSCRKSGGACK